MIPKLLYTIAAYAPDLLILAAAALVFGLAGGLVAYLAHRFWFHRWSDHSSDDDKLMDTVHTSLLGFSAFVLALAITGVSSNLSNAEGDARQESLDLYQLRREFTGLGALGEDGNRALAEYVQHVATDEWPRLARTEPSLSPLAQKSLDDIWSSIRTIQSDLGSNKPQLREALSGYLTQIEHARYARLASATNSIPGVVWLMILLFVAAASFMSGRHKPKQFSIRLVIIHMSAIGLVIALIMILDNPYRGETSVGPEAILGALKNPAGF